MVDLLASEYGWTTEQIMEIPCDQIPQFMHAILHRKGLRTLRTQFEADEQAGTLAGRLDAIWGKIDNAE